MSRLESLSDLRRYVREDAQSRMIRLGLWRIITDPITRFMLALRFNEYLFNKRLGPFVRAFPMLYFRRISLRLGFSIPLNVFREGLAIVHYGTLVVSPRARVGKNCRIHVCVNIGSVNTKSDQGKTAPEIGDNCYIGPGAKIYGPIVIGDNTIIGANAVVGRSFPSGTVTLAGAPAHIISNQGTADFLSRSGWGTD